MTVTVEKFQQLTGRTIAVSAVDTASPAVLLTTPYGGGFVSIANTSATVVVAFRLGADASVAAVLALAETNDGDMVVLPGQTVTHDLPISTPWISLIGDGAGPSVVYVTPGAAP